MRRTRCCGGWPPGTACGCGWRGRRADRQRRPARAGRRDRVRRNLGRGHAAAVAGPGDLPGPDRGPGTLSARAGHTADAQRLDRVLPARPGAGRAGQGFCYDALQVAPVRISGRPGVSAETPHAIAWRSGVAAAAVAFPQTVAVGCRPAGRASTTACLPPQPGRQGRGADAITARSSPRWSGGARAGCWHSWHGPLCGIGGAQRPGRRAMAGRSRMRSGHSRRPCRSSDPFPVIV